jgi:carbon monoxide dehydrogenase subunit G
MEMTGEYTIPAPRERVWQALNDPETLKRAIPGCREIEKVTDTEFTAKVVAKVGPVSATFGGKVNLTDLDPPKAYTISGEGTGGVAGFARGSAKVRLDDEGAESTRLHYEVQAHVGGKLAQIGSRLIDATSRKMADDFFGRFVEALSPPAGGNGAAASKAAAAPAPPTPEPQAVPSTAPQPPGLREELPQPQSSSTAEVPSRRLPPVVWVTGLTAVVAGILYYFTRKNENP